MFDTFDKAVAAAMGGDLAMIAAKTNARNALLAALQKLAAFVQIVADGDMAVLLASGFSANTSNRKPQTKLDCPLILGIENEGTAKLGVRLQPVPYAKSYEVRAINGATTPAASAISTQARHIVLGNLVPGTTYTISARAIGGSEGYSEWSDPVSHMAI